MKALTIGLNDTGATENTLNCCRDAMTALEDEAVQMFIPVARSLGYPRSVGEIFGVLFAAEEPLSFSAICHKRGISAGSLSVGLRHLKSLGMVITVPVAGDRRDHFGVNEDLVRVNASLMHSYLEPRIRAAQQRLERLSVIAERLSENGAHEHLAARLRRLADCQSQVVRLVMPLLKTLQ